ncbi:Intradiol ring-cleavage dioxygenase [Amylocarpus encephaloides]|uniref:Intradiol ring-cleavage dioxygenase n=1 Tax=Amylocarpus encephaloides TaxID=45428 RepID=A0A9P7YR57_9HELO|nr:Intradiol ring-cleavage dioxygenase [Amylocarpus encephaloides]
MAPMSGFVAALAVVYGLCGFTTAHPGEAHKDIRSIAREVRRMTEMADYQKSVMDACWDSPHVRELQDRAVKRRAAMVEQLRAERDLLDTPIMDKRSLADFKNWAKTDHNKTGTGISQTSTLESLFGANASCIFTPDNANGPYYVKGEQIRSNVQESQKGVPMHLEMQFLDIKTCKPAKDVLVDIWSCNATGVYSGVSSYGQGGLNSYWLRGVQNTDADGVVNFDTIFPGHYSGRATHEHIVTHVGAKIEKNGSYTGGTINHLSQLFFEQNLISAVEAMAPYNTNRIRLTTNDADGYTGYAASKAYDPFPSWTMLGNKLDQGLFVWALVGLDLAADVEKWATNAAYVDATGGKNNPKFNMGIVATPPSTHGKREVRDANGELVLDEHGDVVMEDVEEEEEAPKYEYEVLTG